MSSLLNTREQEPIAIVGMGCRFPGNANTPQAFWQLLLAQTDTVSEVPDDRWDQRQFYHPDPTRPGKIYTPLGAFLEHYDQFDATFFGMSPMEAQQVDPQQRLLLETSWEALEDAGLVPHTLVGSQTGVFIGVSAGDYGVMRHRNLATINAYTNGGGSCSIVANRISYFFDFQGPSFIVDTACSSSLVGVHLACESLWAGECSLALVGGVQLNLDPGWSIGYCKAHMLSPSGRCHTFDAKADGYVRGEGVGVVILKPLAQALADDNPIYAVIRATGINQDGKTPSLHQPSGQAQEALLRQVYAQAGIDPNQVSYMEAHGPGTPVGDPIEASAIGRVLGKGRPAGQWLLVGSVKTNLGHLEAASGMAGLMKAALVLKHRHIPANLHFHTPHPDIPFDQLHLKVPQTSEALPTASSPAVAGVNNFGFGGTNAHVVLQEFRAPDAEVVMRSDPRAYLFPLSARSPKALRDLAQAYVERLLDSPAPSLHDLCYSASLHREHHAYRLALVVQSHEELREKLLAFLAGEKRSEIVSGHATESSASPIAFVYSGNGPQWWAMGRQLLREEPVFRQVVERCDHALRRYSDWLLMQELLADEAQSRMQRTDIAQPALFALQIALTALWQSWGITPQAVIGHSVGEIAAAYITGILSFEEAIQVIFERSRWQEVTAGTGKMLAAGLSPEEAARLLVPYEGRVCLASLNSPTSVTLSGEEAALQEVAALLQEHEVFCRFLALEYAFHSPCMNPIRKDLLASLADLHPAPARLPFVSTVTGGTIGGQECDGAYWWDNIRHPVQFVAGIGQLLADTTPIFLEVGPHPVLSSYISECLTALGKEASILPSLRRLADERRSLLASLGACYAQGSSIGWERLVVGGSYVPLPLYPWQQQRYWIEAKGSGMPMHQAYTHPLLGYRLPTAEVAWESAPDPQVVPYLADHLVQRTIIFPAAGYLEMALAAAAAIFGKGAYAIEEMDIHEPLSLTSTQVPLVQTTVASRDHTFHIYSRKAEEQAEWTLQVSGSLRQLQQRAPARTLDLGAVRQRCRHEVAGPAFYQGTVGRGLQLGPSFQTVEQVAVGAGEALGVLRFPQAVEEPNADYFIHPLLLDSGFQIICSTLAAQGKERADHTYLPVGLKQLRYYGRPNPGARLYSYVRMVKRGRDYGKANYVLVDEEGTVILEITGFHMQAARSIQTAQNAAMPYEPRRLDYQVKLRGFRIELGEIETVLAQHPAVRQAVVVAREEVPGDKRLVAYLVTSQQPAPASSDLRSFLKEQLPEYILPSAFVCLEALPLTPNGKVDRRALPVPQHTRPGLEKTFVASRTSIEEVVSEIWSQTFGIEQIGIHDDFIALGGDSLMAMEVIARLGRAFQIELSLARFLKARTIAELSKIIEQVKASDVQLQMPALQTISQEEHRGELSSILPAQDGSSSGEASALQRQEDKSSGTAVVAVQTDGSKRPFFFLHGDFLKGVFYCFPLVRKLGLDQPFYALEPYRYDILGIPPTIEVMAAAHIESLRSVQSEGPYLLGGFCNGGLIAYEMARQLHAQGETVDLLVLIDPPPVGHSRLMRQTVNCLGKLMHHDQDKQLFWFLWLRHKYRFGFLYLRHVYRYLRHAYRYLRYSRYRKLKDSERLSYFGFKSFTEPIVGRGEQIAPEPLPRLNELFHKALFPAVEAFRQDWESHFFWIMSEYEPDFYPGKSTFFFTKDGQQSGLDVYWRKIAQAKDKEVEVHYLAGRHDTCKTIHLNDLTDHLRLCLDGVQAAASE